MTPPTRPDAASRGQTLPDFAVGIAIFLITVTFVVLFLPQLTLPYQDQEQAVVVERVASDLGNHLLAAQHPPSTLNETCTIAFFPPQDDTPNCPFDTSETVTQQVGIGSAYSLNVTLRDAPSDAPQSDILCSTGSSIDDCESGGDRLAIGAAVPENDRSVSMARQRVTVSGDGVVIEVGVW